MAVTLAGEGAVRHHLERGRDPRPHVLRDPRIEDGRGAHAEGQRAHRARVGRVRIGADDEHPGLGVVLQDLGVADRLRAHDVALLLAVQPDPLLLGELALLDLQLVGDRQQALLDPLLAHDLVQEGQVVAEEEDCGGVEDLRVGAQLLLEEDGGHRGHVFVRESDVGAEEARFAGFGVVGADLVGGGVHDPLAGEDLLAEGHGAGGGGRVRGRRPRRRQRRLPLQPRHVELETAPRTR